MVLPPCDPSIQRGAVMHTPAGGGPSRARGLERVGPLVEHAYPELMASKRKMRKVESIECVRLNRESACQNLGFSSRPFVLCGLPVKQPAQGCLLRWVCLHPAPNAAGIHLDTTFG